MEADQSKLVQLLKQREKLDWEIYKARLRLNDSELEPYSRRRYRDIGFPFNLLEQFFNGLQDALWYTVKFVVTTTLHKLEKRFKRKKSDNL